MRVGARERRHESSYIEELGEGVVEYEETRDEGCVS